jgi:hypothetical protein
MLLECHSVCEMQKETENQKDKVKKMCVSKTDDRGKY